MAVFKNNSGTFLTKSLFLEESYVDKSSVVFTLKDEDHDGYPSLYLKYMAEGDPTEYLFANKHLGGWSHWQQIANATWFRPYIKRWREELELKIKALALVNIKDVADTPNHKNSFEASKFLLSGGWKEKGSPVGRPSKEAIKDEAERLFLESTRTQDDLERIKLVSN